MFLGLDNYAFEPLLRGHPWGNARWPPNRGSLGKSSRLSRSVNIIKYKLF